MSFLRKKDGIFSKNQLTGGTIYIKKKTQFYGPIYKILVKNIFMLHCRQAGSGSTPGGMKHSEMKCKNIFY